MLQKEEKDIEKGKRYQKQKMSQEEENVIERVYSTKEKRNG